MIIKIILMFIIFVGVAGALVNATKITVLSNRDLTILESVSVIGAYIIIMYGIWLAL